MYTNSTVHHSSDMDVPRTTRPEQMTMGDRIRMARLEQGLSVAELSRRTGIAKKSIFSIEVNHRAGSIWTLAGIAKELHISLDWMVGLSNNR